MPSDVIRRSSVALVLERIEKASALEPGGVVATDADGTLWSGDVGDDFFFSILESGPIEAPAAEAMRVEAASLGMDVPKAPIAIARALHDAYVAGRYAEERIYEMMAWCIAGWQSEKVRTFARAVLEKKRLAERLHEEMVEMVRRLAHRGIELVIVSASPLTVVEAAAEIVGVSPNQVIASRVVHEGDVALPKVVRPIPYGPGKVQNLRARIGKRPLYAAFGDNVFDIAMLQESKVPVVVRPKDRLLSRISEVDGVVLLQTLE